MKWLDHKLDVKGSLLIVLSITSYFILGKGLFEGVLHFLNEDKVWMSGIYVADFVSYLVILAGFYTILRKMDRDPKSNNLEEENHKHQFYRVVILFVILGTKPTLVGLEAIVPPVAINKIFFKLLFPSKICFFFLPILLNLNEKIKCIY